MEHPLVSIITPCYNSVKTIEATVVSVLEQNYTPIEYIITDAASTDGTVALLRRYEPHLALISEPDRGQADAINKGWRMAHGSILAWLNADDRYFPDTVEQAVTYLQAHPEARWVYGSAVAINVKGQPFPWRNFPMEWNYDALINTGCYVNQPSVFLCRQVIEEFGYLNEKLHYGLDYEYWLRIGRRYPGHLVPSIRVSVIHGEATKTESGGVRRVTEIEKMVQQYGAHDLPRGMRHEWIMAFIEDCLKQARAGRWYAAAEDFHAIWRYPSQLPRSIIKVLIRGMLPISLETRLRQVLVRDS